MFKKRLLNTTLFISIVLFILSFSIQFVINFKPLFIYNLATASVDEATKLPTSIIINNYNKLMAYLEGSTPTLSLPNFRFSSDGLTHFLEVRNLFKLNLILLIVSFIILVPSYILSIKYNHISSVLYSSIFTILTTLVISILSIFFFDKFFVLFHKVLFKNNFWLLDPATDPIINIFPEKFFFNCGLLIVLVSIFLSILFILSYNYIKKSSSHSMRLLCFTKLYPDSKPIIPIKHLPEHNRSVFSSIWHNLKAYRNK